MLVRESLREEFKKTGNTDFDCGPADYEAGDFDINCLDLKKSV